MAHKGGLPTFTNPVANGWDAPEADLSPKAAQPE